MHCTVIFYVLWSLFTYLIHILCYGDGMKIQYLLRVCLKKLECFVLSEKESPSLTVDPDP